MRTLTRLHRENLFHALALAAQYRRAGLKEFAITNVLYARGDNVWLKRKGWKLP